MKRFVLVALGGVSGFALALGVLGTAQGANDMGAYRQFDLFSEAFQRVRANYVRPVTDSELINAAIQGMVSDLDPHSSYMDAKSYGDMQITTRGQFGGVGIEVTQEDGLIKVVSPIDGTPAMRAGIKSGDRIGAIDGSSIAGLALNEAIDKMRGPAGSKITLTILRDGEKKPFDVTLTRAIVQVDAATWRRQGDIGYVRLPGFNEQTADGLEKAVRALKKEIGPGVVKGYILDLRNNPGGLLDQAIQVSDDFLGTGEIVSTRGRHSEDTQRYDAKGGDVTDGKPVVVLINAGTASASEIVSGALQDHKRATVIGMTSFGKGSVQTIIPLDGGGALRLTTARYYTPSGHSIQAQGIIPDIQVAQGDEVNVPKLARPSEADLRGHLEGEPVKKNNAPIIHPAPGQKIDDFQLSYAMDLLHGKMTVASANQQAAAVAPAAKPDPAR